MNNEIDKPKTRAERRRLYRDEKIGELTYIPDRSHKAFMEAIRNRDVAKAWSILRVANWSLQMMQDAKWQLERIIKKSNK